MSFDLNEYLTHIRAAESAGSDTAQNPLSSATGRYQFTRSTWQALGYNWADRFNTSLQETAIRTLTTQNISRLQTAGFDITDANVYAAHFLGPGAAIHVLGSPDSATLSSLLPSSVIAANPFLANMNVGQFRTWLGQRVSGSAATGAGASGSASDGGLFALAENFFVRFGLLIVGGIVIIAAIWILLSDKGIVPSPADAAKGAALLAAA